MDRITFTAWRYGRTSARIIPRAVLIFVVCIGHQLLGLATPTEAGAMCDWLRRLCWRPPQQGSARPSRKVPFFLVSGVISAESSCTTVESRTELLIIQDRPFAADLFFERWSDLPLGRADSRLSGPIKQGYSHDALGTTWWSSCLDRSNLRLGGSSACSFGVWAGSPLDFITLRRLGISVYSSTCSLFSWRSSWISSRSHSSFCRDRHPARKKTLTPWWAPDAALTGCRRHAVREHANVVHVIRRSSLRCSICVAVVAPTEVKSSDIYWGALPGSVFADDMGRPVSRCPDHVTRPARQAAQRRS